MDRERAKFVLRSFRPDGADTGDADFAEALGLATSDLELSEWLIKERAFDADFAECLARVDLPEGLRSEVLLAMVQGGKETPPVDLEEDKRMFDAVASIEVPSDLRSLVIESMERTGKVQQTSRPWVRFGLPLAAAAGIAFAFIFSNQPPSTAVSDVPVGSDRITVSAIQAGFVRTYESPIFSLDKKGTTNQVQLVSHLKSKGLPCGDLEFPPGLKHLEGLGCRELVIDGKRGSLICLDEQQGAVHLIIFRRHDVEGELPLMGQPIYSQEGNWAKACWGNEKYAYSLVARRQSTDMQQFF